MASTSSPISDFFRGRHVLITGATGFMGKVLVEKLLHSCPNIACIYLLIRPKQGHDVKTRLDQLLNATVKQINYNAFEMCVYVCARREKLTMATYFRVPKINVSTSLNVFCFHCFFDDWVRTVFVAPEFIFFWIITLLWFRFKRL